MTDHIYALYHYLNATDEKIYFYVGHTNNIERRFNEHRYAASSKAHCQDVYAYINSTVLCGIFFIEELYECAPNETLYTEDFFVCTLVMAGCPLQNMKKGDARSAALNGTIASLVKNQVTLSTPKEYNDYVEGKKSAELRAKILNEDPNATSITYTTAPGVEEARAANKIKLIKATKRAAERAYDREKLLKELGHLFEIARDEMDMTDEEALKWANEQHYK